MEYFPRKIFEIGSSEYQLTGAVLAGCFIAYKWNAEKCDSRYPEPNNMLINRMSDCVGLAVSPLLGPYTALVLGAGYLGKCCQK